jgi:group I intron endonuclease
MFVYLITNTIDGKRYVGQTTTSLQERFRLHKILNSCPYLHSALKKHGAENFIIEAICEPPSIELMDEIEMEYIKRYCTLVPNGYNLTAGGSAPRHNEATRKKMRLSHLGLKNTEKARRNISKALKGRKHSVEHVSQRWKITLDQANKIRALYSTNQYSQDQLSEMFSINQQSVSNIVRNKSYIVS